MPKFEILYQETQYKTAYVEAEDLAEATRKFHRAWYNNPIKLSVGMTVETDDVADIYVNRIYDEHNEVVFDDEDKSELPVGAMVMKPDGYLVKNVDGTLCYTTLEEEFDN